MKNVPLESGLSGLLKFTKYLEDQNVTYSLHKYSPYGITIFLTLVGVRVEVEFTEEEATFSVFNGNEDVENDQKILNDLFVRHWRD